MSVVSMLNGKSTWLTCKDLRDKMMVCCTFSVIDVLSKFAWVEPVKSKYAPAVTAGFCKVLEGGPRRLHTDKGKEFFNASFANLMRHFDIQHFASDSDQKAAVVERFNRTIKTRL